MPDFPYRSVLASALLMTLAPLCAAHPEHDSVDEPQPEARRVEHEEMYRPSPVPDRIILTWTGDTGSTQTVRWRTSDDVPHGYAQIAKSDHGPGFLRRVTQVDAETKNYTSDLWSSHIHTATFEGLEPGEKYVYRVGAGDNWSEWFEFRTAPDGSQPFSFVYFGDAQNDVRSLWSRVTREAFREAPRAAFFLHAGDLINHGDRDGEWGEWFEAGSFINATVPVIATPGNHEYVTIREDDGSKHRGLTRNFSAIFDFPDNGLEGLESSVYYIDYGDLRVITLNSNERQAEQAEWLEKVLSETDQKWVALTFHHPIFAMAKERDNPELRRLWRPIIERHAVDIVLNGHDHTYGRSDLIFPVEGLGGSVNISGGVTARSLTGTVYVVSVSGPKMYEAQKDSEIEIIRRAEDTQLFQVISIDGDELRYEARTARGGLYDAFTLTKREGRPNLLTEQKPELDEIRR